MTWGRRLTATLTVALVLAGCQGSSIPMSEANTAANAADNRPRSSAASTPASTRPVEPPRWHLVTIPETRPTSILRDVAATDAAHAWAVGSDGYHPDEQYTTGEPMVLQWDGTAWSRMALPETWTGSLSHVAAGSATDVWAVGGPMSRGIDDVVTRVLRYDGTSWREIPFPAGNTPNSLTITDLAVVDGHAWLVGHRGTPAVVLEWDGNAWREHQLPDECVRGGTSFDGMPNFCNVVGIRAFAPDDIWAAGNGAWSGFLGPLLYHWDGTEWRTVQVGLDRDRLALSAVDGRSATDLWAVGDTVAQGGAPLAVHGDGKTWQVAEGLPTVELLGLALNPDGQPWVIANTPASSSLAIRTGTGSWESTEALTPPDTEVARLHAITAVPDSPALIAVGAADLPGTPKLLTAVVLEYSSAS